MTKNFTIARSDSAKSKNWKNGTITWESFTQIIERPRVSSLTLSEYKTLDKAGRMEVKDVGGYLAGELSGPQRKSANLVNRCMVTLDIDDAHPGIWEDFIIRFSCAALLHSTTSHTEAQPRYRLIVPLSEPVDPQTYEIVARHIADILGAQYFDSTTFQPIRLMFWPLALKDVPYVFKRQDGEFMSPWSVLGTTRPVPNGVNTLHPQKPKEQADPTAKGGIVGAFCRTYNIHQAISSFLSDTYTPTDDPNRYSYVGGSTAGGLVVYDDGLFCYSHHHTDSITGRMCNAWDLVRIHLFLDETGEQASETRMLGFVSDMPDVVAVIQAEARDVFSAPIVEDWRTKLQKTQKGALRPSSHNLRLILENDEHLAGAFRLNKFNNKPYVCQSVPWREIDRPEPFKDLDLSGVRTYIETVHGIDSPRKVDDNLKLTFDRHSYHPIREYLSQLKWDGRQRLDSFMVEYFGAQDSTYTREAFRKTLVAAVARVFRPGTKFDHVPVLVGPQGTGKSTLVKRLGGEWASDTFLTVHGKESFEQLQGVWLMEMAELAGLRKAEVENIKHFISKQEDTFRPAYGRLVETFPRQCVFIGTTNNKDFLRDATGNRRFWPISIYPGKETKSIFNLKQSEIDQIWAEAVYLYQQGEPLYLGKVATKIALQQQRYHQQEDARAGMVQRYLNMLVPDDWYKKGLEARRMYILAAEEYTGKPRTLVCAAEIWAECFGKNPRDLENYKTREVNDIMRQFPEWVPHASRKTFPLYGRQRYYELKK